MAGHRFTSTTNRPTTVATNLAFGVATVAGGLAFVAIGVMAANLLALAAAVALIWIGGSLLGPTMAAVVETRRFGHGVLDADREAWDLRSAGSGTFRRRVPPGGVPRVEAVLILHEWARWTNGTDIRTVEHEADRLPVAVDVLGSTDGEVVAHLRWTFPSHPPSFEARSNKVRWILQVELLLAGGGRPTAQFLLPVLPRIAREERAS